MEDTLVDHFIHQLRLDQFESELGKGEETLSILEHIVGNGKWTNAGKLLNLLQNVQMEITAKMPWETTPCNMVDRVIKVVKDEYSTCIREQDRGGQVHQRMVHEMLVDPATEEDPDMSTEFSNLRDNVVKVILELKAEMEQCLDLIAVQGESKVHIDEVILTSGYCPTVFEFLKQAAKKHRFHVVVGQCAPLSDGNKMASQLSEQNISTTLVSDSAIFALMSRVSKVIIGTRTVLNNGGIKTFVGATLLATIAKFHSVPLYVCCPTYVFSQLTDEETNQHKSPDLITQTGTDSVPGTVRITIGKFDYVPPELVTSFITNNEGIPPSSVYRLLSELYRPLCHDI